MEIRTEELSRHFCGWFVRAQITPSQSVPSETPAGKGRTGIADAFLQPCQRGCVYGDPSWRDAGTEILVSYGLNFCSSSSVRSSEQGEAAPPSRCSAQHQSSLHFVPVSQGCGMEELPKAALTHFIISH